ncbi:hypothetical protein [Actinoplanes couchii]|uniref:SAF domain protein n=1 Tax=Actinoplanes couchii TaxID=403638 RepID=A0ABQ3X9X5_9ACTN|nr:hypothetical protein [Actinoplanes couchii]MDR6325060.1 hypothetical protein [Actinoplanes couchii]GID55317.1 hypothetical protein Aco03nite_037210 [Actinoplanes couchii]
MSRASPAERDERLDPVRWHRPTRGTTLRLISVAVLLLTAAAVLWFKPATCTPLLTAPGPTASSTGKAAPQSSTQNQARDQTEGKPAARAIPSGSVGVPIRLADPTALSVVRPGNRVDLLRLESDKDRTTPVANAALVLEVTGADDPVLGGLLLALAPEEAKQAIATTGRGFAIVIRPS